MTATFTDLTKPQYDPAKLPRGVIKPPQRILDDLARKKVEGAPYFTRDYEILSLNHQTLIWYFENHSVIYRPTPDGPEVLAVDNEIEDYVKNNPGPWPPGVVFATP
jgi:hypothetical protein